MASKEKWEKLKTWMRDLQIQDEDLVERFIVGSGRGGQKLHKTASTVYLNHKPSGIEVKCQESRSREDNRFFARVRLCEKLQTMISDVKTKAQQDIEKIRRQKKRRSRRSKLKMVDEKTRRGRQKLFRKKIQSDES